MRFGFQSRRSGRPFPVLLALALAAGATAGSAHALNAASPQALELIPASRAHELPAELRADRISVEPELLLQEENPAEHRVQLRWQVREIEPFAGYRVTLVSGQGLSGNVAARRWIALSEGRPAGNGLTDYVAEISLDIKEATPVAAAVEVVALDGTARLLAVGEAVAEVGSSPTRVERRTALTVARQSFAVVHSRSTPKAAGIESRSAREASLRGKSAAPGEDDFTWSPPLSDAVSPRGPPASCSTIELLPAVVRAV
ncbi:MAG: hypothetical protein ABI639_04850 [Thermoanaerobaculia bacterium]